MVAPSCATASDRFRKAAPLPPARRLCSKPTPAPEKAASIGSTHFCGSKTSRAAARKHSISPCRTPGASYSHREVKPQAAQPHKTAGSRSRLPPSPAARPAIHQVISSKGCRACATSSAPPKAAPTQAPTAPPPKVPAARTVKMPISCAGDSSDHSCSGKRASNPPKSAVSLPHNCKGERLSLASRSIMAKPKHSSISHNSNPTARTPPESTTTPLVNPSDRAAHSGKKLRE